MPRRLAVAVSTLILLAACGGAVGPEGPEGPAGPTGPAGPAALPTVWSHIETAPINLARRPLYQEVTVMNAVQVTLSARSDLVVDAMLTARSLPSSVETAELRCDLFVGTQTRAAHDVVQGADVGTSLIGSLGSYWQWQLDNSMQTYSIKGVTPYAFDAVPLTVWLGCTAANTAANDAQLVQSQIFVTASAPAP